jgi:hypothetical protein
MKSILFWQNKAPKSSTHILFNDIYQLLILLCMKMATVVAAKLAT